MATSSMCAANGASSGELSMVDAFSRQDHPGELHPAETRERARIESPAPAAHASRQPRRSSSGLLPDGYLSLRDTGDMALLGRWTPLDDKMSPCLPARVLAAMQRRHNLGDEDAAAWLKRHARAYAGDPDAQRVFGRVCESGLHRASADLQRAFFWYYRASLQGDAQARRDAERLMHSTRISSLTMAEPLLVYPGQWRITAQLSCMPGSASVFELAEDGAVTGCLLDDRGEARCARTGIAEAAIPQSTASSSALARYHGGWAFDGIGHVLTLIFDSSGSNARRWRSDYWQIEMLGCKTGSLFGRDRRMVAYTLEHLPQGESGHA